MVLPLTYWQATSNQRQLVLTQILDTTSHAIHEK